MEKLVTVVGENGFVLRRVTRVVVAVMAVIAVVFSFIFEFFIVLIKKFKSSFE